MSILPSTVASVVVADDHPLYRAGIVRALVETRRFAVAGEADDGERAFELIASRRPALAIVDVRMPRLDGLGVVARLAAEAVAMGRPVRSAGRDDGRPAMLPIERHILRLLRAGWPLDEIPRLTGLNRAGVDRHIDDTVSRLGAAAIDDAVASAMAWGLLD